MSRRYVASVANAFKIGYKLLDFSAAYGNMNLIGKAIRVSGVDRKDLFITTRVSNKGTAGSYRKRRIFERHKGDGG